MKVRGNSDFSDATLSTRDQTLHQIFIFQKFSQSSSSSHDQHKHSTVGHRGNLSTKFNLRFLASPTLSAAFFSAVNSCWIPVDWLAIFTKFIESTQGARKIKNWFARRRRVNRKWVSELGTVIFNHMIGRQFHSQMALFAQFYCFSYRRLTNEKYVQCL